MEPTKSVYLNIYELEHISVAQCDSSSGNAFQPLADASVAFSAPLSITGTDQIGLPGENFPNSAKIQTNMKSDGNGKPRVVKFKVRRHKANARERNRMHGLNAALDKLRRCIPIQSRFQKLSKIETLRLAKNYIEGMSEMLKQDLPWENTKFAKILTNGMSQGTSTAINGYLSLNPKNLFPAEGNGGVDIHNPVTAYETVQHAKYMRPPKEFNSDDIIPAAYSQSIICSADPGGIGSPANNLAWDWSNGNSRTWTI